MGEKGSLLGSFCCSLMLVPGRRRECFGKHSMSQQGKEGSRIRRMAMKELEIRLSVDVDEGMDSCALHSMVLGMEEW